MKQINIQNFTKPDKTSSFIKNRMFCVFLGNNQRYYFTSQKACNLFIVKTNQFLNDKFKHLNMLYGQIFVEYRKFYIFCDSPTLDKQTREIIDNFKTFEHCIEMAATGSTGSNGNYYAVSNLFKAIRCLMAVSATIIEFYKARKHYENIYGLNFIIEQLTIIDYQINTYGVKIEVNEDIILLD